jgi:hypothetical protein
LRAGNAASYSETGTWIGKGGAESSYRAVWSCAVTGTERVSVMAGDFDTYKIVCKRYYLQLINERFQLCLLIAGEVNKLQTGSTGTRTAKGLIFRQLIEAVDPAAEYSEEVEPAAFDSVNIDCTPFDDVIGNEHILKFQTAQADVFDPRHFTGVIVKDKIGRFRNPVTL